MATIALYSGGVNGMPGLINDVRNSVKDLQSELFSLKKECVKINSDICNLEEVITSIQASTQTQEEKITSLEAFGQKVEQFVVETVRADLCVAVLIEQGKNDFYEQYGYLKPECEKNDWEKFYDNCENVGEWCREHWKEMVKTVFIIAGAVVMIIAVIGTGGMGLAPMLTAILTAFKIPIGLAVTIATVTSLCIGGTAILSTVGSTILNIMGVWSDYSDNSVFTGWQSVLNWTCMITSSLYCIGSIYNGINGISNQSLREYGKSWLSDPNFRADILNFGRGGNCSGLHGELNFSNKALQHMGESGRQVPMQTLQDAIMYGEAMPDPQGSSATMYYTTMYKNGKMYNLQVLYDAGTNIVYHFEYARKAMGNFPAIK